MRRMSPSKQDLEYARTVLAGEAEAVAALGQCVDDAFAEAVGMIHGCAGQVVLTANILMPLGGCRRFKAWCFF